MARTLAVPPFGDADPERGLLEWRAGGARSAPSWIAGLERALGLTSGLLGLLEVDLAGHVGCLGHDDDPVGPDLEEPADDRERLLDAALAEPQLADAERRYQRRMVRQDAELALASRAPGPSRPCPSRPAAPA